MSLRACPSDKKAGLLGCDFITFDNNRRAKVRLFCEPAKIFRFFLCVKS